MNTSSSTTTATATTPPPGRTRLDPSLVRALAILWELAQRSRTGISALASATDIPIKRVERLVGALRRRGLVRSIPGRHGGVALLIPIHQISALDVASVVPHSREGNFATWFRARPAAVQAAAYALAEKVDAALGAATLAPLAPLPASA